MKTTMKSEPIDTILAIVTEQEERNNQRFSYLEKLIMQLKQPEPAKLEPAAAPAKPAAPKPTAPRKPRKNGRFWQAMAIYLRNRHVTAEELHHRIAKAGGDQFSVNVLERTLNAIRETDDCLLHHGVNIRSARHKA